MRESCSEDANMERRVVLRLSSAQPLTVQSACLLRITQYGKLAAKRAIESRSPIPGTDSTQAVSDMLQKIRKDHIGLQDPSDRRTLLFWCASNNLIIQYNVQVAICHYAVCSVILQSAAVPVFHYFYRYCTGSYSFRCMLEKKAFCT